MTHWNLVETPFGNIVYAFSPEDENGETHVRVSGAGALDAASALTTNWEGDTVPNWEALKAEARRIADDAGTPLAPYWTPDPAIVVNGKGYTSTLMVVYYSETHPREHLKGSASVRLDGVTDAARRKLTEWFQANRAALIEGEPGRRTAVASAEYRLRRAATDVEDARAALAEAERAHAAAVATLDALA